MDRYAHVTTDTRKLEIGKFAEYDADKNIIRTVQIALLNVLMFDNNDDLSWFGAEFGATKKWHESNLKVPESLYLSGKQK